MKSYDEARGKMISEKDFIPSKTAFQQYCRNAKKMTYQSISSLTGTGKYEVWKRCNGEFSIRAWGNRTDKEIRACEKLFNLIHYE
jgi:hypothetical protein